MKQKMAFFDFDNTLLSGDSIKYLSLYYIKKKPLAIFCYVCVLIKYMLYICHLVSFNVVKSALLFPLNAMTEQEIQDFFRKEIEPRYYPNVVQELIQKKQAGYTIYIVSA